MQIILVHRYGHVFCPVEIKLIIVLWLISFELLANIFQDSWLLVYMGHLFRFSFFKKYFFISLFGWAGS